MTRSENTHMAQWWQGQISDAEFAALESPADLEALQALKAKLGDAILPPLDTKAAYNEFKATHVQKSKAKSVSLPQLVVLLAAAVVGFVLTFALISMNRTVKIEAALAQTTIEHMLPDGSMVQLNDGSSIRYRRRNWTEKRAVKLEGEAHFQVRKGSQFQVDTDKGNVRVLGTVFNVRVWEDNYEVHCVEGSVAVAYQNIEEILVANEKTVLQDNRLIKSITNEPVAWLEGQSRFIEADVNDVFKELQRQYDIEIIGLPLGNRSFNGIFEHGNLGNAAAQVCRPLGIQFSISADSTTLQVFE